jgi:hypothetical protein
MSYAYPFLLRIYVKKGGGVIKHTTLLWQHVMRLLKGILGNWLLALLINGILDICVNNQSRRYWVFKLNFRDILNYFMLLITGILVSILQRIRDMFTPSKKSLGNCLTLKGACEL